MADDSEAAPIVIDLEAALKARLQADDGTADPGGATAPRAASTALSKLTVHGFLSQAYATADFATGGLQNPTTDEVVIGIPEDGTSDYRTMAIQFRYEITQRDIMIVQLSSRSLGDSPINDAEDDIELDWAFYERRLGDRTYLKIGRIQIPLGIFNELRDVGTVLPFYRPSYSFYNEGSFTSETVDGILFGHTFSPQSAWSLDLDVYFGEWELFEFDPFSRDVDVATAEDAIGFQLWLNTPVEGLRLGLGGNRRDVSGGNVGIVRLPGAEDEFIDRYLSFDLARERFVVRAEYRLFDADPNEIFFGGDFTVYYAQLGYHATDKLRFYVQHEGVDIESDRLDPVGPFGIPFSEDVKAAFRRDTGVALNYLFAPNLVLKVEHHFDVESEFFTLVPVFTPAGPVLQPVYDTATGGEYSIVSFSASF